MQPKSGDDSERSLVKKAAVSQSAREDLKQQLLPHVIKATRAFMHSAGIPASQESELIGIGMEPFERVFGIYLKNAHHCDTQEGHFYEYYLWWMRKAIAEHLRNSSGQDDLLMTNA